MSYLPWRWRRRKSNDLSVQVRWLHGLNPSILSQRVAKQQTPCLWRWTCDQLLLESPWVWTVQRTVREENALNPLQHYGLWLAKRVRPLWRKSRQRLHDNGKYQFNASQSGACIWFKVWWVQSWALSWHGHENSRYISEQNPQLPQNSIRKVTLRG